MQNSPKSLRIRDGLYLVAQPIDKVANAAPVQPPANRLLIFDESGSMCGVYRQMIQDAIAQVDLMPERDTLSIGWFSSQGQFGWIVKGMSLTNKQGIKTILERHQPKYNMTCFSEIFADAETVVSDLAPISENFSLMFLTDGDDNQGESRVLSILGRLASRIRLATVIGYGDWYNRARLSAISQAIGASFVHANGLKDFRAYFSAFNVAAGSAEPKTLVLLNAQPLHGFAFTLTNDTVEVVKSEVDTTFAPKTLVSVAADAVYFFHREPRGAVQFAADNNIPAAALYAGASALSQNDQVAESLDVLGFLGDVALVNEINNSFTTAEYGQAEAGMLAAVYSDSARFTQGCLPGCVPDANAFCLLDLLDMLAADEDVAFLPNHPAFKYKRIGRGTKQKPGYPEFKAAQDVQVKLRDLVWSSSKLNIGALITIPGTIQLDARAASFGLDELFSTYIWRNYALVSDGKPNVTRLPLKNVSPALMEVLERHDLIESQSGTVVVNLTKLPVINRTIAQGHTDLNALCGLISREKQLQVENKVYGHFFGALPESLQDQVDSLVRGVNFTPAQMEYLTTFGVRKDGSFSPEVEKEEATDVLYITEIEFDIKGMASIPKIADVLSKLGSAKKPTPMQEMIGTACKSYESLHAKSSEPARALWLKEQIQKNRRELADLRSRINRARFAVVLGKVPFVQLPRLDERTEYTYGGTTYVLKIDRNVEVPI